MKEKKYILLIVLVFAAGFISALIIKNNMSEVSHDPEQTQITETLLDESSTGVIETETILESVETVAEIFQQLSDPTRIRIFWLLCHYEECVINISAILDMSSPAVSHHLRPLKNSGLIVSRREGKEVYYRAADTKECRLLHKMIEEVMEIKCPN